MTLPGVLDERVDIAGLPDALLAAGVHAFTTADAAAAAEIKQDSVRPALARLIKNGLVFSPARGLYIPIPPEFRSWGAVPAMWFVDPLMAHLDRTYYVGYLSAAEVHGAAHQRPQALQVVVDRDLRDRSFGRVRLRFITNRNAGSLPTVRQNTPTGTVAVSTPELTALDLANRPDNGGALHNVATVLIDLAREEHLRCRAGQARWEGPDRCQPTGRVDRRAPHRRPAWRARAGVGRGRRRAGEARPARSATR